MDLRGRDDEGAPTGRDADSGSPPWRSEQWFTSPWNARPAPIDRSRAGSLRIHDTTLRDGERQAGVVLRAEDKVRIAAALAEAGVQRIEAGWPVVSDEDQRAIREIVRLDLPAQVYAYARPTIAEVDRAAGLGVAGVVIEAPASRRLIELGQRWSMDRVVEAAVAATGHAHACGLAVSFLPGDASRASLDEYIGLCRAVARDGHLDALVLADTSGTLTPQAVRRFVRATRRHLAVPLETHFHMDFGLGVANSLIALAEGASVLQVTVGGLGERAGNTPLEATVVALRTLCGLDIGIRLERLTALHRLVMTLAGVGRPSNQPITGDRLFDLPSGSGTAWSGREPGADPTGILPFLPDLVGQRPARFVVGHGSDRDAVVEALERTGQVATDDQVATILGAVRTTSLARHDDLTDDELERIAHGVLATTPLAAAR